MTWQEAAAQAAAIGVHLLPLPFWAPMAGITLGSRVFLKRSQADSILHELVHVRQQRRDGLWRFLMRYVFSRAWRLHYESEAYASDVIRGQRTLDDAARSLSGPLYLWMCSFSAARRAIQSAPYEG